MSEHVEYCVFADAGNGPHLHYYHDLANAEKMYEILCAEYPEYYVDITELDENGHVTGWVKRNDEVTA